MLAIPRCIILELCALRSNHDLSITGRAEPDTLPCSKIGQV